MRRPWCPATRILEYREAQALKDRAGQERGFCTGHGPGPLAKKLRADFPALKAWPATAYMHQEIGLFGVFISQSLNVNESALQLMKW